MTWHAVRSSCMHGVHVCMRASHLHVPASVATHANQPDLINQTWMRGLRGNDFNCHYGLRIKFIT